MLRKSKVVGGEIQPPKDHPDAAGFPAVGMTLSSYQQPASALPGASAKPLRPQRRWLKRTLLSLLVVLMLLGGWAGWKFLYNTHRLFGGNIFGIFNATKLKGEDSGRVNILLAGNSADDPGHQGAELTDSIMILSLDTKNHQAFMLSIPRDLYVEIPGHGHQKINAANVDGNNDHFQESDYPNGGMGLLEKTLEEDLGITINYYALVNYQAFRQAVDAVGGIDVTIQSPDKRGLYDPSRDYTTGGILVKLSNGVHHLNGQQALNLARARGDAYGSYGFPQADFDRTAHQRQMLVALKSKASSTGTLANPVKLGNLFDALGRNVKTDFSLSEVRRAYDLTKDMKVGSIQSLSLNNANGKNLLASYRTPRGESALVPVLGLDDYSQIQAFIQRYTSNNPVVKEQAAVVVLNGTNHYGVAATAAQKLEARYVSIVQTGDAKGGPYASTQIIDLSSGHKPATLQLLKGLYGINVTTTNPYTGKYQADIYKAQP